jgi:hypothetical protein
MTDRMRPDIISPAQATGIGEAGPFPFDLYEKRCLAQGDSWFSIGALPPTRTTRLIAELRLEPSTVIVNCAFPGAVLRHMTDTIRAPDFVDLLTSARAMKWDALLLSGGGNDLIDACSAPPTAPPGLRLLRTPAERGVPSQPSDYISTTGWLTFAGHLRQVFEELLALRDGGMNRQVPLVWHNYARVMPRPSGAGAGFGPWLLPALDAFGVAPSDRLAVSDELLGRLRRLIDEIIAECQARDPGCAVFVADSMSAGVTLAEPDTDDLSGDWINEIHLTRAGYAKCAVKWQQVLDPLLR